MATNTDGRERLVLKAFADIYSQKDDLFELGFSDMNSAMGTGETLQIPASPSMTIYEATSGSGVSVTDTFLDLECNKPLSMFLTLPQLSQLQNLGGNTMISFGGPGVPRNQWTQGTLNDALTQLKKRRSQLAWHYLRQKAWTSAASTYYDNVEGDTLTERDVMQSIAELESLDGSHDIALFMHPFGLAALSVIPGYQPIPSGNGNVGAMVGMLFGRYPVYQTTAIGRGNPPGYTGGATAPSGAIATAQTASAVASSSGAFTFTLPSASVDGATVNAGGFILGEKVYAPATDNPVTEANAGTTTTATATSVVFTSGSSSDADELTGGAYNGLLVSANVKNLVVDRAHLYRTQQIMPMARIVNGKGDTDDELQITARFGFVARAGRARVLVTPKTTL